MPSKELSREELFALVWEKPTQEVARDLGVSDVAIAKLCARLQVPKPPRGCCGDQYPAEYGPAYGCESRRESEQSERLPLLPSCECEWGKRAATSISTSAQKSR